MTDVWPLFEQDDLEMWVPSLEKMLHFLVGLSKALSTSLGDAISS